MAIQTFERVEKKFLITTPVKNALLERLSDYTEPDAYCRGGGHYSIRNLYYDTPDSRLIRQSIAKPYFKEKLRMRCYTPPASPDDPVYLEIKRKAGGVVTKRRISLPFGQASEFVSTGQPPKVKGASAQQIGHEIAYFLSVYSVQPMVFIRYDRLAFFGKDDSSLRITFDSNLLSRREVLSFQSHALDQPLLEDGVWLMEIKFSGAMPLWLAALLSEMNIYSRGYSKYGAEFGQYLREQSAHGTPAGSLAV